MTDIQTFFVDESELSIIKVHTVVDVISQINSPNAGFLAHLKLVITVCKIFYAKFCPNYLSDYSKMTEAVAKTKTNVHDFYSTRLKR